MRLSPLLLGLACLGAAGCAQQVSLKRMHLDNQELARQVVALDSLLRAREAESEILNRAAGDKYPHLLELITAYGDAQLRGVDEAELGQQLAGIDALLDECQRGGAGQVAVKLADAEAQADQTNQGLRREYEEFTRYLEQRRIQPEITLLGLWVQMRREVLGHKQNEIIFLPEQEEIEIHVKSDPQRKAELEEERALKRQRGGR